MDFIEDVNAVDMRQFVDPFGHAPMFADWHQFLNKYENVEVISADHCSSNYNNHSYLVDGDGELMILYREDDGEDCFEVGSAAVSKEHGEIINWLCAIEDYELLEEHYGA